MWCKLVQDPTFEDLMTNSSSKFDKPSEFQKIWYILLDRLSYAVENIPTYITWTPPRVTISKMERQKLYNASSCNPPCKDNNGTYYGINHGLKKDIDPHVDISATYLWLQDNVESH